MLLLHPITLTDTYTRSTPLDEGSARGQDLYLTVHNTHKRHPCLRPDSNS